MPAAFGTLVERLSGMEIFFAPDGSLIGTAGAAISKTAKPATPSTAYADYSLGRVNQCKYDPKFKDTTREWGLKTGGYTTRTDKKPTEDALVCTMIDYAPQLFDQIMFGTANLAAAGSQQLWANAARYKDGWFYAPIYNESGVAYATLEFHGRLSISNYPDLKNEAGSPAWRVFHLKDAGALDTIASLAG